MTPQDTKQYLNSLTNYEHNLHDVSLGSLRIDRVRNLLTLLGNPQGKLNIIHVAGSKGKGSVCVITAHVLKAAGYHVGLFTSPHFYDVRERIRLMVPGEPTRGKDCLFADMISEDALANVLGRVKEAVEKNLFSTGETPTGDSLTFFEVLTVAALLFFSEQSTDFVVLETGLGGRLDATNAVTSLVGVVTPISLEHTNILGKTVTEIALEKAGILKGGEQQVVLAPQPEKAFRVLMDRCADLRIKPLCVGLELKGEILEEDFDKQICRMSLSFGKQRWPDLSLPLLGRHQLDNAATALGILATLQRQRSELWVRDTERLNLSVQAVKQGFADVFWPGRMEIVHRAPTVLVDAAHNPASAENLVRTVAEGFPGKKIVFVVGLSQDKDARGVLKTLCPAAYHLVVTKSRHPRARRFTAAEVKPFLPEERFTLTESIEEALTAARKRMDAEDILVVTGSIFTVAEARELCISGKV